MESNEPKLPDNAIPPLPDFNSGDTGSHLVSDTDITTKKVFIKINDLENTDKSINELVKKLYYYKRNSIIDVWISSYGGSVDELIQIVNTLSMFKNRSVSLLSSAMSCGALLFLTFPDEKRFIFPNTSLMIHNYSSWLHGTPDEIENTHAHYKKVIEGMIKNLCYPYMTKKERTKFENGKDIFLRDIDLLKRSMTYKISLNGNLLGYKEYKEYLEEVESKWKK